MSDELGQALFLFEDPLGKNIIVDDDVYRVIGVLRNSGRYSNIGAR